MANLNSVMIIGRLTRDPETRYTAKGTPLCEISVATTRIWKDDTGEKQEESTFIDCILWRRQAEIAQQYLQKGREVFISGRLQLDSWEDRQTGQKRSRLRVVAENMQLLGGKPGGTSTMASSSRTQPTAAARTGSGPRDLDTEPDDIDFS
jgi:single-strand DNA-binding protein